MRIARHHAAAAAAKARRRPLPAQSGGDGAVDSRRAAAAAAVAAAVAEAEKAAATCDEFVAWLGHEVARRSCRARPSDPAEAWRAKFGRDCRWMTAVA